jgi:hypothetical protein
MSERTNEQLKQASKGFTDFTEYIFTMENKSLIGPNGVDGYTFAMPTYDPLG